MDEAVDRPASIIDRRRPERGNEAVLPRRSRAIGLGAGKPQQLQ